jgi:hypothetical protein
MCEPIKNVKKGNLQGYHKHCRRNPAQSARKIAFALQTGFSWLCR